MKIEGVKLAERIAANLKAELKKSKGQPSLAVILVGDNPASLIYVGNKRKKAESLRIGFKLVRLPMSISQTQLIQTIQKENRDKKITGIIVQLPLPAKFNSVEVLSAIDPNKDADGLHPANLGKLFYGQALAAAHAGQALVGRALAGQAELMPATPAGILEIFKAYKIKVRGKKVVLLGFTPIVNMPLAVLLGRAKASVVILQETEKNQASFVKEADIVISAVGKKHFIKENWIKKGAVLIDVGVSYQGGKIFGDFEPSAYKKAALYTPVPGGVGPLTVICLLRNVVRIFLKESKAKTSIDRVY